MSLFMQDLIDTTRRAIEAHERAGETAGAERERVRLEAFIQAQKAAVPAEILEIAQRLATQDNRATDAPIFIVEEKRRLYGFDTDYASDDEIVWRHSDGEEASRKERARLDAMYEAGKDAPEEWTRTAYLDQWHFVTACFTEAGCNEYIRVNKHNHRGELRVYAAGSWRNAEWRTLREWLLSIAGK